MERERGQSLVFIILLGSLVLGINLIFTRHFFVSKKAQLLAQLSTTTSSATTSTSNSTTFTSTSTSTSTGATSSITSTSTSTNLETALSATSSSSTLTPSASTDDDDDEEEEDFSPQIDGDKDNLKGIVKIKMKHKIKANSIFLKISTLIDNKEILRVLMPSDFFNNYEYLFNTKLVPDDSYYFSFIKVRHNKIKESGKIKVKIINNDTASNQNSVSSMSQNSSNTSMGTGSISSTSTSGGQGSGQGPVSASESGSFQQPIITFNLKLNKNPQYIKGKVKVDLEVNVPLLSARIALKKINTGVLTEVGEMIQQDNSRWSLEFDSRLYTNDSYDLLAVVISDYGETWSPPTRIVINNNIKPPAQIVIEGNKLDLKDRVKVKVKVEEAEEVSLFIRRKESLVDILINKLIKSGDDEWQYEFNSKDQPNGDYILFVRVKNIFGEYKSDELLIKINNPILQITEVQEVVENLSNQIQQSVSQMSTSSEEKEEIKNQIIQKLDKEIEKIKEYKKEPIKEQQKQLTPQVLQVVPQEVKVRLNERFNPQLKTESTTSESVVADVTQSTSTQNQAMLASAEELNKVIEQRIEDLDNDGLTNEVEISIYKTDPLNADTDNDGFIDGLEVFSGFAPDVPSPADKIIYEEPKSSGIEKPDIYKVKEVKLEIKTDEKGELISKKLVLKGTALPHSFVTLYIYSLPTVLVVKADEFGNWEYHLEKDLGEGEHTVYVALTDNKGKVVEKSAPLKFVQQAQAISIVDIEKSLKPNEQKIPFRSVSLYDQEENSLLSDYVFLGFVITVVAFLVSVTSLIYVIHKYSSRHL